MKSWIESKTIWANVIGGAVALATAFGVDLGLTPETQATLVAGIMVVVNIVLRFMTTQAIK